ncbi:MAG: hypothetical protein IAE79_02705 [Anaerolinea sp.]|nr:hypothetical protein [Anaerolinea sp.]
MGRKCKQAEVTDAVRAYLATAVTRPPDEYTLDVKSVAAAVGVSRTSLYKYDLAAEIKVAASRQRESVGLSGAALQQRRLADIVHHLRQELKLAETRNKALLGQINIIEANAARLGVDPEELYKPLAKPVRAVSQAGRGRNRRSRRFSS